MEFTIRSPCIFDLVVVCFFENAVKIRAWFYLRPFHSIFKFLGNLVKFKAEKTFDRRHTPVFKRIQFFSNAASLSKLTKT